MTRIENRTRITVDKFSHACKFFLLTAILEKPEGPLKPRANNVPELLHIYGDEFQTKTCMF